MMRRQRPKRLLLVLVAVLVLGLLQVAGSQPADAPPADAPPAAASAGAGTEGKEEMAAAAAEGMRRRERETDLEERIKFRQEMVSKYEAEVKAEEDKLRTVQVTYGAVVVLKNKRTLRLLAGTSFRYIHDHGSGQNQVVAMAEEDGYTHWRVMPRAGQRWELVKDVPVANGDVVRLLNMRTERNLHSHKGPKSPVSGNNEVSNFGEENGSIDPNDNWVVETGSDATWHMGTSMNLLHAPHKAPLRTDSRGSNATFGHDEVYCKMPPQKKATHASHPGEWMAKPVSGGSMNVGFDRWVALYESQDDQNSKYKDAHADGANGPKEISIYCPSNPVVSVSDLDYNLVSEGKCLALNLQSPHFESSLTLNCDPNNDKRGGGKKKSDDDEEEKEKEEEEPDEI